MEAMQMTPTSVGEALKWTFERWEKQTGGSFSNFAAAVSPATACARTTLVKLFDLEAVPADKATLRRFVIVLYALGEQPENWGVVDYDLGDFLDRDGLAERVRDPQNWKLLICDEEQLPLAWEEPPAALAHAA